MADRLDVVALGVDHEGAMVIRVAIRTLPKCDMASTTGLKGSSLERIHLLTALRAPREVTARAGLHRASTRKS